MMADAGEKCELEYYLNETKELIQAGLHPKILGDHFSKLRKSIASCKHDFHLPDLNIIQWLNDNEAFLGHFLPFSTPEELEESCFVLNFFQPFNFGRLYGEEKFVSALRSDPLCMTLLNDYSKEWVDHTYERLYSQTLLESPRQSYAVYQIEQEQR